MSLIDFNTDRNWKMFIHTINPKDIIKHSYNNNNNDANTLNIDGNLDVSNNSIVRGQTFNLSDDRNKHNEIEITNALDIIQNLTPYKYQKTTYKLDENFSGELPENDYIIESGFIAQDIKNIPDLSFIVSTISKNNELEYYVNYNNLFAYLVSGIKELNNKVISLENENTTIKNALNELLSEANKSTI